MKEITILEIVFVVFLLMAPIIAAYLGIRVLKLTKRVKLMRVDRNRSLEIYTKSREENAKLSNSLREKGIEIDQLKKERPKFDTFEKKLILVALNRPGVRAEMKKSTTSHGMKRVYENLKEKIKKSFDD